MSPQALEYTRIIISVVSVAFAVYMGLRGNHKADNEEREERIRTETRMDVKLNDVLSATKDTRDSVKDLQREIQGHNNRIVVVEESVRSLTRRIEAVEQAQRGN